jgi:hypothetical protein
VRLRPDEKSDTSSPSSRWNFLIASFRPWFEIL